MSSYIFVFGEIGHPSILWKCLKTQNSLHWAPSWFPDHHSESTPHIHWHPPGYGEPCHTFHSLHQLHPWISSPFLLCIKKQCLNSQSLSLKKSPSPCDPEWTTLEQLDANRIQDDAFIIDWFPSMPFSPCKTGVSGHSPTPSAGDFEALVDSGSPSRISLQKELHWILKNVKNRRSPSCRKNPS